MGVEPPTAIPAKKLRFAEIVTTAVLAALAAPVRRDANG